MWARGIVLQTSDKVSVSQWACALKLWLSQVSVSLLRVIALLPILPVPYSFSCLQHFKPISLKPCLQLTMDFLPFFWWDRKAGVGRDFLLLEGRRFRHLSSLQPSLCPCRVCFCYGEESGMVSQWVFFPLPCQGHEGTFLGSSPGELGGGSWKERPWKWGDDPYFCVPQELPTVMLAPTEPPAVWKNY